MKVTNQNDIQEEQTKYGEFFVSESFTLPSPT